MSSAKSAKRPFIGLQFKMLLPLMLLFAVILVATYFALDGFIKDMILKTFQEDIRVVANQAATCVDAGVLVELYNDAQFDEDGVWYEAFDDERYLEQNNCLEAITLSNPRAYVFTYYVFEPGADVVVGLDSDAVEDPDSAWAFGEFVAMQGAPKYDRYVQGMSGLTFDPDYTSVKSGASQQSAMVAGYAPVTDANDEIYYDENGNPVVGLAIFMSATSLLDQLLAIKTNLLLGLVIAFVILLVIVFLITLSTTASLRRLTQASGRVGEGNYDPLAHGRGVFSDETSRLTETFNIMIDKVRGREEKLKQQVQELQIIIDTEKKNQQVEEVTGSEFFQDLQSRARQMRRKREGEE